MFLLCEGPRGVAGGDSGADRGPLGHSRRSLARSLGSFAVPWGAPGGLVTPLVSPVRALEARKGLKKVKRLLREPWNAISQRGQKTCYERSMPDKRNQESYPVLTQLLAAPASDFSPPVRTHDCFMHGGLSKIGAFIFTTINSLLYLSKNDNVSR